MEIGTALNRIVQCQIRNNKTVGILIRDSENNCFTGNVLDHNAEDGAFIADGDAPDAATLNNARVDNQYTDNGRNGIWQAGQRSRNNCETGGTFSGNAGVDKKESFPPDAPRFACPAQNASNP